jgi:F0F1-type ATP synthase membrane subunit a
MWETIAIVFVLIIGAFLLGMYVIARRFGKIVSKSIENVPEQVVKEVFTIVKDKINKSDETRIPNNRQGNTKD